MSPIIMESELYVTARIVKTHICPTVHVHIANIMMDQVNIALGLQEIGFCSEAAMKIRRSTAPCFELGKYLLSIFFVVWLIGSLVSIVTCCC